jgi:hypothetical protein
MKFHAGLSNDANGKAAALVSSRAAVRSPVAATHDAASQNPPARKR